MLRSPPDVHDEHVRMLLDQRTTRADLQRVSSFSDYEDTPSVYSRAFLTPRLSDDHRDGRIPSPSPPASRSSSMPRRIERNRINELAVSMLDLDESEDNRTSFASASTYEDDMRDDSDNELDGSPMPRMSLLGPKMRVHSKAPWEVDSPLIEDDEGEMSAFSGSGNTPFHSVATGPAYPLPRVPFPSAQEQSPLLLPTTSRSPPQSYISSLHDDENSTLSRIRSNSSRPSLSSSSGEEAHPYANPNHARSSSSNSYKPPLDVTHSYSLSSADSTATETPFGRLASMSDSQADLLTPVPRSPRSIFQGKEISSPLPFHQTNPQRAHEPPEPSQLPGWMDKGSSSPNFNLISLEEARAQRSRSTTMHGSASSQPFPEREITSGHSPNNSVASRARARSISAGARAKHAITSIVGGPPVKPDRRDSEPSVAPNAVTPGMSPGKNLKHKKSGFLRLFNGRDDKSPPPPVPSLSDNFAAYSAHQGKPSKTSPHRIPVPKLDPPLAVDEPSPPATSPKRTPPPLNLSIDTSSPIPRAPSTGIGHFPSRLGGNDSIPRSAPANVTEFPSLKLRPVSTMFSAHFGDILSPSSASPPDIDTPISSTLVSPTSSMRFGDLPSIVTPSDDQSSVIRALQEQITASKKVWQRHIWELEGQIRDLKDEVEGLRRVGGEWCVACGRGEKSEELGETKSVSVVNRPRARTGTGTSRFGSAV